MARYVVASVSEIPVGERKIVHIAGRSVGIFNLSSQYFALRNRCPHQGGPVCLGWVAGALESSEPGEYRYSRRGEFLRCPWHGWEFDIRTGQSWFDPVRPRVGVFRATVELGEEILHSKEPDSLDSGLQKGPYVAEVYTVTVEEQYVVVEIS